MAEDDARGSFDAAAPRAARGSRGAVVAPHHLATAAGLAILEAGGHAVDAAIATNAVLAVVMPHGCGLGGDAFWLVWDETSGDQVALNGSGGAPSRASAAALRAQGLDRVPLRGPLSITVPGAVRSWGEAHRRWGRLSRDAVLGRAVELAAGGFPAWPGLVGAIDRTDASLGSAPWAAGFRAVWRPGGRTPATGEGIRLPALARTLRALADDGFDALYDGEIGVRLTAALVAAGAPFTHGDLRSHRSAWTTPIATTYRGVRVTTHPPNSSGLVALEALGIAGRFDIPDAARFGTRGWTEAAWPHVLLEAAKLALADRDAHLADPAFAAVPVEELLSADHAATRAARIDPARADPAPGPVRTLVGGTIYLAVVDAEGNAVSLIQSGACPARACSTRRPGSTSRTAARRSPWTRRTSTSSSRASARPTRSCRACCSAPGSDGRGWWRARWAATSSRSCMSRSCRRWWTVGPTSPRPSRRHGSPCGPQAGSRRRSWSRRTATSRPASSRTCAASVTPSGMSRSTARWGTSMRSSSSRAGRPPAAACSP